MGRRNLAAAAAADERFERRERFERFKDAARWTRTTGAIIGGVVGGG